MPPRSASSPPLNLFAAPATSDSTNGSTSRTGTSNGGGAGAPRSYASIVRGGQAWDMDDVERREGLDDLNPFDIPPIGSAPWRREVDPTIGFRYSVNADTGYTSLIEEQIAGSSRLGPRLSLDDLLGAGNSPGPSTGPPNPRTLHANPPRNAAPSVRRLRLSRDATGRDEDSWAGAIDAARRQGYPSADSEGGRRSRAGMSDGAAGEARRLNATTWPALEGDTDLTDSEDDDATVTVRRLYGQENRTSDDLRVLGGSGGAVTLNRGSNNRRRRSLLNRLANEFRIEEEVEERPGPLARMPLAFDEHGLLSNGMKPTNEDIREVHTPLVVRSVGVRKRDHPEEDEEQPRKGKRRKMETTKESVIIDEGPPSRPTYLSYTTLDPSIPIPNDMLPPDSKSHVTLEHRMRHRHLGAQPIMTFDHLATIHGERNPDANASALRTMVPIPLACGIHYYEVEVIDAGDEGHMSVGWVQAGIKLGRLVGWEPGSWGWHGDDGKTFEGKGTGHDFGEKWGTGDTVGCGIDYTEKRAFFTKNGKLIGHRFKNLGPGLYPAIGLKTYKETVAINFTGPFKYDIDNHVRNARDTIWRSALRSNVEDVPRLVDQLEPPLSPSTVKSLKEDSANTLAPSSGDSLLDGDAHGKTSAALVLDYLAHTGLTSTLILTEKEMTRREWITGKSETSPDSPMPESPALRADPSISDFPSVQASIEWLHTRLTSPQKSFIPWALLDQLFPNLPPSFERSLRLHDFSVRVHRPSSALSSSSPRGGRGVNKAEHPATDGDLEVIAEGRELLKRCKAERWDEDQEESLHEIFTVFGAPHVQSLVNRPDNLHAIAGRLIHDIRMARGLNPKSHLEQAIIQTSLVGRVLAHSNPSAAFVDVRRILEIGGESKKDDSIKEEPIES